MGKYQIDMGQIETYEGKDYYPVEIRSAPNVEVKISIVVPFHWMKNWQTFLTKCLVSIEQQYFKNYEVILTKAGSMPVNTNRAIGCARGELIKVLYMDDYFSSEYALDDIVMHFEDEDEWMITGCNTNPHPRWTNDIETGNNKLGSPSVLTFRNHFKDNLLFDEKMSWLLDCDLYKRMHAKYGLPKILNANNVYIGQGDHQMTHILTPEQKLAEHNYLKQKYGK